MAKGVEDTAFYRYNRFVALNEVGGSPGRFSLALDDFHAANLERARRFPAPPARLADARHQAERRRARAARRALLAAGRVAGARPRESRSRPGCTRTTRTSLSRPSSAPGRSAGDRLDGYLEKALREGEGALELAGARRGVRARGAGLRLALHDRVAPFAAAGSQRSAAAIALVADAAQARPAPASPDVYQGDELWSLNLVDPDNRRPVDWERRRRALDGPPPRRRRSSTDPHRARRGVEGDYEPVDAGPDICAFTRGDRHLVAVPLRRGAAFEPPRGWRP